MAYKIGDEIGIIKDGGSVDPVIIESIDGDIAICYLPVNPEVKVTVSLVTKKRIQ